MVCLILPILLVAALFGRFALADYSDGRIFEGIYEADRKSLGLMVTPGGELLAIQYKATTNGSVPHGEGVSWSHDREVFWRLENNKRVERIKRDKAIQITRRMGISDHLLAKLLWKAAEFGYPNRGDETLFSEESASEYHAVASDSGQ